MSNLELGVLVVEIIAVSGGLIDMAGAEILSIESN